MKFEVKTIIDMHEEDWIEEFQEFLDNCEFTRGDFFEKECTFEEFFDCTIEVENMNKYYRLLTKAQKKEFIDHIYSLVKITMEEYEEDED